jgi:imidazolonepropionase
LSSAHFVRGAALREDKKFNKDEHMKNNIIIKNASQLVTCSGFKAKQGKAMSDLHVIDDGAVVIEDGIITAVGRTEEVLGKFNEIEFKTIDATGKAILPGFIDSHTHFVFGGYRAEEFSWRLGGEDYMEIMRRGGGIVATVNATREASREDLIESGRKRLDSMLSFGVTTVEGKSGYGLDEKTELKQLEVMGKLDRLHPIDIVRTFLGAHAVPEDFQGREDQFIDYMTDSVMPQVAHQNLAEFCDVFCEKGVFSVEQSKRLLIKAKELGLKLKIHADEIFQLGGTELAAELGAISADHLLHASDKGIAELAKRSIVATLLPGTAFSLKESYARGRYIIDQGCAVALATDFNPGSCFTESIPLIFVLATLYMGITIEEAVTALTINGAAAIDRADKIGSIDVGKAGDVIILEFPSYKYIPYHIGVSCVEKVIKNGKLVFDKENKISK